MIFQYAGVEWFIIFMIEYLDVNSYDDLNYYWSTFFQWFYEMFLY